MLVLALIVLIPRNVEGNFLRTQPVPILTAHCILKVKALNLNSNDFGQKLEGFYAENSRLKLLLPQTPTYCKHWEFHDGWGIDDCTYIHRHTILFRLDLRGRFDPVIRVDASLFHWE